MVSTPRWGGLRPEPYDPDAVDGDNDGIVQEGTAWERPVGTRLLDKLGREIIRGHSTSTRPDGLRYVDRNGQDVTYMPRDLRNVPGVPASRTPMARLGHASVGTHTGHTPVDLRGLTLGAQGHRTIIDSLDPPNEPLKSPDIATVPEPKVSVLDTPEWHDPHAGRFVPYKDAAEEKKVLEASRDRTRTIIRDETKGRQAIANLTYRRDDAAKKAREAVAALDADPENKYLREDALRHQADVARYNETIHAIEHHTWLERKDFSGGLDAMHPDAVDAIREALADESLISEATLTAHLQISRAYYEAHETPVQRGLSERADLFRTNSEVRSEHLADRKPGTEYFYKDARQAALEHVVAQIIADHQAKYEKDLADLTEHPITEIPITSAADRYAELSGEITNIEWFEHPTPQQLAEMNQLGTQIAHHLYGQHAGTSREGDGWSAEVTHVVASPTHIAVLGDIVDERGRVIGEFRREIDPINKSITHGKLEINRWERDKGIGGRFVFDSMYAARDAGFTEVTLDAANGEDFNGYLKWPEMGFTFTGPIEGPDAEINKAIRALKCTEADLTDPAFVLAHRDELEGYRIHAPMRMALADLPDRAPRPEELVVEAGGDPHAAKYEAMGEFCASRVKSLHRDCQRDSLSSALSEIDTEIEYLKDDDYSGIYASAEERALAVKRLEEIRDELATASWFDRPEHPMPPDGDAVDANYAAQFLTNTTMVTSAAHDARREIVNVVSGNDTLEDRIAEVDNSIADYQQAGAEQMRLAREGGPDAMAHLQQAARFQTMIDVLKAHREEWVDEIAEADAAGPPTVPTGLADQRSRLVEIYDTAQRSSLGHFREKDRREVDAINRQLGTAMFVHSGVSRDGQAWSTDVNADDVFWNDESPEVAVSGTLLDEDLNEIGWFNRTFNVVTGEVHHDIFEVDPTYQDNGMGGRFVAQSLLAEKQAGFKKVTLQAANGPTFNGLVKWPGFGFVLTSNVHGSDIDEAMSRLGVAKPEQITEAMLLNNPDLTGLNLSADMVLDLATWNPR